MNAGDRPPERDTADVRRSKLIGRAIIVGLGLLLLAYVVVTFANWR